MNYIYRLNETAVTDEGGMPYTAYGIDAVDQFGNILSSYTDIFFDRSKAEKLAALCSECKLELIHLPDIVENSVTEQ